jgi:hypothetical protein
MRDSSSLASDPRSVSFMLRSRFFLLFPLLFLHFRFSIRETTNPPPLSLYTTPSRIEATYHFAWAFLPRSLLFYLLFRHRWKKRENKRKERAEIWEITVSDVKAFVVGRDAHRLALLRLLLRFNSLPMKRLISCLLVRATFVVKGGKEQ